MSLRYYCGVTGVQIRDWVTAFDQLRFCLKEKIRENPEERQVVFIDELPWMDTPRSMFVSALEHFWNGWGAGVSQLMLIVCGSATAWISDHLLHAKGGLYNRKTREIKLRPFSLKETELFLEHKGVSLNRYDQLRLYMMLGGIPYYLSYIQKGKSVDQIRDYLFDARDGVLRDEVVQLFVSLFTNHEECLKIIHFLAKRKNGFSRKDIAEATNVPYGGGLSKTLLALSEGDFITKYTYYGKPVKEERYRLSDFFTLFQFAVLSAIKSPDDKRWKDALGEKTLSAWYGSAFETLCWNHLPQIKKALGILAVHTEAYSWRVEGTDEERGTQIDLLIRRADHVINLCEVKFSIAEYVVDKEDELEIRNKIAAYQRVTGCKESLSPILITTYGLHTNIHSSIVQQTITMDDLFES